MKTNAKKKVYVSPKIEVHEMEMLSMLAASTVEPSTNDSTLEDMDEEDWGRDYSWS